MIASLIVVVVVVIVIVVEVSIIVTFGNPIVRQANEEILSAAANIQKLQNLNTQLEVSRNSAIEGRSADLTLAIFQIHYVM